MSLRQLFSIVALASILGFGVSGCDSQPAEDAVSDATQAVETVVEKTEEVMKEGEEDAKKEEPASTN